MKKYLILIVLSLLLVSQSGKGQPSLGISQYAFTVYDTTVAAYSTDSVAIYIVNKGDSTFTDSFSVIMAVQDSVGPGFHHVDTASSVFAMNIPAGDSIAYTLYPQYTIGGDTFLYHYDINVIVIWPVALTASTEDSLMYTVTVMLPESIQEISLSHLISAFPNPTTAKFTLENKGKNSIEEVRIYDSRGRLIDRLLQPEYVCTDAWAKGTYLIHIQTDDGKQHVIRILKQ